MMKKLLLILLLCSALFASAPFTLDNLGSLRVYVINKTDFIDKKQELSIKELAQKKISSAGILLNKVDSSTLMIKIESAKIDETTAVVIQIAVGEEVITKRKENIQTLAFTYFASDFIDSQEPSLDTMESVEFLLDGFVELYHEDME